MVECLSGYVDFNVNRIDVIINMILHLIIALILFSGHTGQLHENMVIKKLIYMRRKKRQFCIYNFRTSELFIHHKYDNIYLNKIEK